MGSFAQANEIMEFGIREGRKLYPRFKQLADSLNAIYGPVNIPANRLPNPGSVKISSYEIRGLKNTSADFFAHTTDLSIDHVYTPAKLTRMVRAAFGTRYYSRVVYALEPQPDSTCRIVFDVTENPLSFAKIGLHYNKFSGIAAIINLTTRNFFVTNSRSMATINIGDALRAKVEHLQFIGRRKNFAAIFSAQYDQFNVSTYNTYKQDGLYKQQFFKADGRLQYSTQRNFSVGIGQRFETVSYTPKIASSFQFSGNNNFTTSYVFIAHNSLDKAVYPGRGLKINAAFDWVYGQDPNVVFFVNGQPAKPDSLKVSGDPYPRITFNLNSYIPLSHKSTLEWAIQSGINFNYQNNIMNEFSIGGLTSLFRNQVTFAGLQEGSLYSPAVAAFQAGYRYELFNNTFVIGRANILFNNFISRSSFFQNPDILTGYSLTFGYNFALGPLEFSLMYSDQSKIVGSYVNIGIPF
jgi:NTE family protein